jgi:hypothetical protein|nr:MAG TPA: hypothetical protein [Caudoviricetes sp.]
MAINVSNVKPVSTSTSLQAWAIHTVVLESFSYNFNEKNKSGTDSHVYDFKFSNDNGSYTARFFCPVGSEEMKKGGVRQIMEGNDYASPSEEEQFVHNIRHIVSAFGDNMVERVDKYYAKHDPTASKLEFEAFGNGLIKLLGECNAEKPELELKLIGNKDNYARTPGILGIKKDGTIFIKDNYVAKKENSKLAFTAKQMEAKAKIEAGIGGRKTDMRKLDDDDNVGAGTTAGAKQMDFDVDEI